MDYSDLNSRKFIKVPIEEILTPRPGKICYPPAWLVTVEGNVFFYADNKAPQCNPDRRVVEYIYPGLEATFIEMAFINQNVERRNYYDI